MKLFNDNAGGTFTRDANQLYIELEARFREIAEQLDNPRDLHALVNNAVSQAVALTYLRRGIDSRPNRIIENENTQAPQ